MAELARLDPSAPRPGRAAGRRCEAEAADVALEIAARQEQIGEAAEGTAPRSRRAWACSTACCASTAKRRWRVLEYGERLGRGRPPAWSRRERRRARAADAERLQAQRRRQRRRTECGADGDGASAGSGGDRAAAWGWAFRRPPCRSTSTTAALDESGADGVEFLFAPNPGEPARELARIASGGELSRVALAIKTVLAHADRTPTLIFDEIDAGIGGRSADPVGRMLWRLARDHQVVCVTHLPQIAAYADAHLRIEKQSDGARTTTSVDCSTPTRGATSSPRCSAARPASGDARRSRRHADSRPERARSRAAQRAAHLTGATRYRAAIDGYLDFLRVERGLPPRRSPPTPTTCATSPRSPRRRPADWRADAAPATRLPGCHCRGRRACSSPATPSAQGGRNPRVLSLLLRRGDHRAGHRRACSTCRAPRASTARHARRGRGRGAARRARRASSRTASAIERCWSCCTPAGCASARRSAWIWRTSRCAKASVRVIGKGDRERRLPVGDVAIAALERYLDDVRPVLPGQARERPLTARRPAVRQPARPAAGAHGGLADDPAARRCVGGDQRPRDAAYSAPQLCHPSCSKAVPTCASCRNCSDTRASRRRSCTRT